jgi:hypothetical protein
VVCTALFFGLVLHASVTGESKFKFALSKETHIVDATSKAALVIAFVVVTFLLLFFGRRRRTAFILVATQMKSQRPIYSSAT